MSQIHTTEYLEDNILYKKINEMKMEYINIKQDSKRKVKIKMGDDEKYIHILDLEYNKKNKIKKDVLLILPKQKIIEIDKNKTYIKMEINDDIERKIKELENYLKEIIYKNSILIFNGKKFSTDKINKGLVSNIRTKKEDNKYIKYISLGVNKKTKFYELDKSGNRNLILDLNKILDNENDSGKMYCKSVISIENLQFIDNIFTYNLVIYLCEIEKYCNYSFVIKNGELRIGEINSDEESDKLEDEYWDSASI